MKGFTPFYRDDRAASSVVATIILVAIVVVLGTAVTAVALGVSVDIPSPAPQATFEFSINETSGDVIVTKENGKPIDGDKLKFAGAAVENTTYGSISEWSGQNVEIGDSAEVKVTGRETLQLVWQSSASGSGAVLAEYETPGPTASIGSIVTGIQTYQNGGYVDVNNIQFQRTDSVYVVVEDEPDVGNNDGTTDSKTITTSGADWTADLVDYNIDSSETITVTVYDTESDANSGSGWLYRETKPASGS